jgi:hypothetical protein
VIFGNFFKAAWAAADEKAKQTVAALISETETLVVKIIVRSIFVPIKAASAVGNAYDSVKAFFGKKPASSPTQPCALVSGQLSNSIASWKQLIEKAKLAQRHCPNIKDEDISKLQKQVNDSEKALMANDVYAPYPGREMPGWTRLSDEDIQKQLKLDPNAFHSKDSEFLAALYKSNDAPPKYCLAFKGTTLSSGADWENNILQGLGLESDYYKRAQILAGKVFDSTDGRLEVTGHSLGGGLASAAAAKVGVNGTTFNPAGLSQETLSAMKSKATKPRIDAYQVEGEPLTWLEQKGLGPDAVGNKHRLKPQPEAGLIAKHSMDNVMYGMGQNGAGPAHELVGQIQDCAAAR